MKFSILNYYANTTHWKSSSDILFSVPGVRLSCFYTNLIHYITINGLLSFTNFSVIDGDSKIQENISIGYMIPSIENVIQIFFAFPMHKPIVQHIVNLISHFIRHVYDKFEILLEFIDKKWCKVNFLQIGWCLLSM